ncbi:MAG: hypothetical protein R3B40_05650 [Polyangiales bacterium]|nr:hypothetical protein [Myxococcales bacterium]MCB9657420.1 hypothetical protein [Sandaracinaceae bacterium]
MISWLASDFFAQSPVLALPIAALLLFMALFTVMAVRALRLPIAQVETLAQLPMEHDTQPLDTSAAAMQENPSHV